MAFEPRALRRTVVVVLLLLVGLQVASWAFEALGHFLFLLLLAWLLAIGMDPGIAWLERRGFRRGLGAGLLLLGIILATTAFLVVFGGLLFTQLAELIKSLPDLVVSVVKWLNDTFRLSIDAGRIVQQLNIDPQQATEIASQLAGGVLGILGSLLSILFDLLTVLVFSFYVAADGPRLRRTIGSWLPPRQQRAFVTVWDIALQKTGGFVVSKVALASLSALFHTLFFWLIDIPYWLPMGLFAGVVSQLIPTIGTYIGVAVPLLFAVFDQPIDALWIVLFATVYQQVENYVFTPRISSKTMDIHPAIALGAVFVGAAFFGPIGAIIGIPLAAAVLSVVSTYGRRYELVPELREQRAATNAAAGPAAATSPGPRRAGRVRTGRTGRRGDRPRPDRRLPRLGRTNGRHRDGRRRVHPLRQPRPGVVAVLRTSPARRVRSGERRPRRGAGAPAGPQRRGDVRVGARAGPRPCPARRRRRPGGDAAPDAGPRPAAGGRPGRRAGTGRVPHPPRASRGRRRPARCPGGRALVRRSGDRHRRGRGRQRWPPGPRHPPIPIGRGSHAPTGA